MRLSKFFFRTLKEAPAEADNISHQLLERGGYLKKLGKGIYVYTPLMWRVLRKLMEVVRCELNRVGCQEVSLPHLHPSEVWQKTGRWDDFTSANLLYTLKDREGHAFCLGPTHEEIIVSLVADWVTTYKSLPLNLYQIGTKFRDEIRPRFGLIRCKEFIMKDGYSFSSCPEDMEKQYSLMRQAYSAIFKALELDFVIVEAHGGKIGKGKSEEFQVRAEIGEDAVMVAGDYAANVEAAIAIPPSFNYEKEKKEKVAISTPNISSIEALSAQVKLPPQYVLKTVIYKLIYSDREEFVAIGIRGDRQVNDVKVSTFFGAMEIVLASEEEVKKITGCVPGFAGPINLAIPFYADKTCLPMTNFLCAANEKDVHYLNVNWERDCPLPEFQDFLTAEEGDACPFGGTYKMQKGIEVGHIFNLGTRYTEALRAYFQDEEGQTRPFWMGTYGIGIGRVAAACIEQKHDAKGIVWPKCIAPYKVLITAAATNKPEQVQMAERLYEEWSGLGYEVLYDDREERIGFKLKDSDLIGIPYKVIIGKAFDQEQKIEIESRQGEKLLLTLSALQEWAQENLNY